MPDAHDMPSAWACPACRYDMTGTPTPICPECGIDALAELERRRVARVHRDGLWMEAYFLVLPAISLVAALTPTRTTGHRSTGAVSAVMFAAFWGSAMVWVWVNRRQVFARTQLWRITIFVGAASFGTLVSSLTDQSEFDLTRAIYVLAATALVVTATWLLTPGRCSASLLTALGAISLSVGGFITLYSMKSGSGTAPWSNFTDPRIGQIHDQYPLRWDEVRLIGTIAFLLGATVTARGVRLLHSKRQRS